jgi:hypothetical protein
MAGSGRSGQAGTVDDTAERFDGMVREPADRRTGRVAGAAPRRERRLAVRQGGMRAAGVAGGRVAAPIIAGRGGGVLARLKAEWRAIIGDDLAGLTWPAALARDGVLKLRVEPRYAVELQHCAPLVIERINGFFGRVAVRRLALLQGPLPLAAAPARAAAPPRLDPAEQQSLDGQLAAIGDPELRAALARLGQRVLAGARHRR